MFEYILIYYRHLGLLWPPFLLFIMEVSDVIFIFHSTKTKIIRFQTSDESEGWVCTAGVTYFKGTLYMYIAEQ